MIKRRQLTEFHDRGFTVVPDVFSEPEVHEMLAAFDRLENKARELGVSCMYRGSQFEVEGNGDGRVVIRRIVWCGAAEPVLSVYGRDPRLLKMAGLVLGSWEMNQLINQAHFTLSGDGVAIPWHQDSTDRPHDGSGWQAVNCSGRYVQTIVALDAITEQSGPLEMIPGSHRMGLIETGPGGEPPAGMFDESRAESLTMRPGAVMLLGPYTLHRSTSNVDRRRRIFINGFAHPGADQPDDPGNGAGRLVRVSRNGGP